MSNFKEGSGPAYPEHKRYQVLAAFDPEGKHYYSSDDYDVREDAVRRTAVMILQGYRGVRIWDTLDNPMSRVLGKLLRGEAFE